MDSGPDVTSFPHVPSVGGSSSTEDSAARRRQQLASAQLYLCTDTRREKGDFAEFVDAAYAGGVDIIQIRDKTIEAAEELACFEVLRAAAEQHGKLYCANDRADIARLSGASVFHIGQQDLPVPAARQLLGPEPIIGLSTHSPEQALAAASAEGLDYYCTGPVWATPTKPGRAAVGLELVRYAAVQCAESPRPWFAIGGIDSTTIQTSSGRGPAGSSSCAPSRKPRIRPLQPASSDRRSRRFPERRFPAGSCPARRRLGRTPAQKARDASGRRTEEAGPGLSAALVKKNG